MRRNLWTLPLLFALLLIAGCRQQAQQADDLNINIDLRVEPEDPTVGPANLIVNITDDAGNPVIATVVKARGDMNHAGMEPVLAEVESGDDIFYTIPFEWTMAGDWIVEITAELPDGNTVSETFDLSVATGDGDAAMDMGDMDMAESTEMPDMTDATPTMEMSESDS